MALTPKHERFCQEYVKDLNGSKAYKRAYPKASEGTCRSGATNLLAKPNIQTRISEIRSKDSKRLEISKDMVIKRLADIAFANIGLVCTWDENGTMILKDMNTLTEGELAAVDNIQCSPVSDGAGGLLGYNKKVKMKDSLKALEMLSKHLGLLDGNGGEDNGKGAAADRLAAALERIGRRSTRSKPGST